MSTVLTFLVLGAGIGFIAGISPGPVLTLVVSETLRGGWLRGAVHSCCTWRLRRH